MRESYQESKPMESAWDEGMKKIDHLDLCLKMMRGNRGLAEAMRENRAEYGQAFYQMISEIKTDDPERPEHYSFYDASLIGNCTEALQELMDQEVPIGRSKNFYSSSKTVSPHDIRRLDLSYFQLLDRLGYHLDFREDRAESSASYVMGHARSVEEVQYFLKEGMPADFAMREYMKADTYQRREIVQLLIDNFADVNYKPHSFSLPPLYYALASDSVVSVDLLVEAGADVNVVDEEGFALIMILVSDNMDEAIDMLLDHEPNLDLHNGLGDNLLMMAIYDRDGLKSRQSQMGLMEQPKNIDNQSLVVEILDRLIEAGVNPYEKTKEGWTLVEYAKRYRMFEVADHLEHWMQDNPEPEAADEMEEPDLREADSTQAPNAEKSMASLVEELKSLKELVDLGILTQEEFDQKKKIMLGI